MIVLVGGEKGGTGKSTLACNLAVQRSLAGHDVLLVDADTQKSASFWAQIRDETEIKPRVACIQKLGKGLQAELRDLARRYEDIIIDAGGGDGVELRASLVVAEKAYIPTQASQFDIWTLDHIDNLVATAQEFNQPLEGFVVLARASPNPLVSEVREARGLLQEFENLQLADTIIYDRIAWRRSIRQGLGVTELLSPDRKASAELQLFYQEVFHES